MTHDAADFWHDQADEPAVSIAGRIDPQVEDAYWQSVWWTQPWFRSDLDYEDYAPAFCAGYVGQAQYGGTFADAEKSLCANWLRIKGDSRLTLEEALQAMRAAWAHAERAQVDVQEEAEDEALLASMMAARRARPAQPALALAA